MQKFSVGRWALNVDVSDVRRIILTASGGPFRETPRADFDSITPEQALKHPTWNMGPKITIDSATLFNKGLEMIEAHWLFGVEMNRVEVVIHPQSIVHSMVEFTDCSTLAQLSYSNMCFPIQYAVTWPDRVPNTLAATGFFEAIETGILRSALRRFSGIESGSPRRRNRRHLACGNECRQRNRGRGVFGWQSAFSGNLANC